MIMTIKNLMLVIIVAIGMFFKTLFSNIQHSYYATMFSNKVFTSTFYVTILIAQLYSAFCVITELL